jgi:ribose transport system substrate-binding protein
MRTLALPALLATALVASACGTSSSSSGSSSGGKVGPETIGLLYELKAAEISVRGGTNLQQAADALGWKLVQTDPAGDPQKAVTGANAFVTQRVNAILSAAWESSVLRQPLQQAKTANIPTVNIWGGIAPNQLFTASLAPDEKKFGSVAATEFLKLIPSGSQVAMLDSGQFTFGAERDGEFKSQASAKKVSIVADHQTDYTNPQADTTKAVNDILSAHPDIAGIWSDSSLQVPEIAQVLQQRGLCGKVHVVGFYGDIKNLQAVRDGCVDIIADVPLQAQSWAAMDAFAAHFKNGTPLPKALPTTYPFDVNQIQIVTKSNVPSDPNAYVDISYNYKDWFKKRWAAGTYGPPASK